MQTERGIAGERQRELEELEELRPRQARIRRMVPDCIEARRAHERSSRHTGSGDCMNQRTHRADGDQVLAVVHLRHLLCRLQAAGHRDGIGPRRHCLAGANGSLPGAIPRSVAPTNPTTVGQLADQRRYQHGRRSCEGLTFSKPLKISKANSPAPPNDPNDHFSFVGDHGPSGIALDDAGGVYVVWADWTPGERAIFFSAINSEAFTF